MHRNSDKPRCSSDGTRLRQAEPKEEMETHKMLEKRRREVISGSMLSYSVFISEPFVFQLHHLGLTEWIICVHLFLSLSSSVTQTSFATSINLLCLIQWAVSSDPLLDILLEANFTHLWQWDWKHMNSKSKRCGSILFYFPYNLLWK